MIRTLQVKDLTKEERLGNAYGICNHPNYAFYLDSIKDKTFFFKPGLNVLVGENGSGKTALLNIIRHLTFCDKLYGSSIAEGREHWKLQLRNAFESGYWLLTKMEAQYTASTFNLRKESDFDVQDLYGAQENFYQKVVGGCHSDGESIMETIRTMLLFHRYGRGGIGEIAAGGEKKTEFLPHHFFKHMVLDELEKSSKTSEDEEFTKMCEGILAYYKENNITQDDDAKTFNGFTFLMDEPDKGLDINNIQQVYNFLSNCPANYQEIVTLHNIGLIHKLRKNDNVHFIEMSEGYLDKIEEFLK